LIDDRLANSKGLTGFDGVWMGKGDGSGHINGKVIPMVNRQSERAAA